MPRGVPGVEDPEPLVGEALELLLEFGLQKTCGQEIKQVDDGFRMALLVGGYDLR